MKIFVNKAEENWVCDRFADEWYTHNSDISTKDMDQADVIWLMAGWVWSQIPLNVLKSTKVVVTQHHVDPVKFNENEFKDRDMYVDCYHVTNQITAEFLSTQTEKPIHILPFWGNPKLWFNMDKNECRKELGLPSDKYLIGSFQRDTEGFDLKTPKLSKGPDVFCDMIEKIHQTHNNVEVVLGGWRRQYIMKRLDDVGIKYHYFELPPFETINKLYNSLDLYVVAARIEGGPQAIIECALSKTPIISTDVGVTNLILAKESIYGDNQTEVYPNINKAYENAQTYIMENWFGEFRKFLKGYND